MMRDSTSLMPPPGRGTMNFTVRAGNAVWAAAEFATSAAKIAAAHAATRPFIPASPAPMTPRSPPSRLVASTEGRLALAQSGKLPHARAARILVGADIGVDQIGPPCRVRSSQRLRKNEGRAGCHRVDAGQAPPP